MVKGRGGPILAVDDLTTKGYVDAQGHQTARLTKNGNLLQVNGVTRRFGATNMYWVGLDDNAGVPAGSFPTRKSVTEAMKGAREMGVGLVRAHTVGMSAGLALSFETAPGVFNDANMDRADWAVAEAKRNGIYLITPLTDNWNYYHGGKGVFVNWAYQQNPSGITALPQPGNLFNGGSGKDSNEERQFFANTAGGLRIRQLFKDYISAWLNHYNPYTGLKYKDDPTIAIVETGNEIYYAAQIGSNEWTQDIAAYIKSIAPNKLVMDGSGADRQAVSTQPGLTAAAVDIVGAHYYPQLQVDPWSANTFGATTSGYATGGSALLQLPVDAANAKAAGKVFIVGEYPWTRSDVAAFHNAVQSNADIAAAAFWSIIGNDDSGTPLAHGGAFGGDDYPVHRPFAAGNETTYGPALATVQAAIQSSSTTVVNPTILYNGTTWPARTTVVVPIGGYVIYDSRAYPNAPQPSDWTGTDRWEYYATQPVTLGAKQVALYSGIVNSSVLTAIGIILAAVGTQTASGAIALTNIFTRTRRVLFLVTTAAATAIAGWRETTAGYSMTSGFTFQTRFGSATGAAAAATRRWFVGMTSNVSAPTDVDPSTNLADSLGLVADAADVNFQFMGRTASGTAVKMSTGILKATADSVEMYDFKMVVAPSGTSALMTLTRLSDGVSYSATMPTVPAQTALLAPRAQTSVGGTSAVVGMALALIYIEV